MYVFPPTGPDLLTGDIIKGGTNDDPEFWIILTPSCDLVASWLKAEWVLLAKCFQLEVQPEYSTALEKGDKNRFEPFKKLASNK